MIPQVAPPTSEGTTTTTAAPDPGLGPSAPQASGAAGLLAFTGSDVAVLTLAGVALMLLGVALMLFGKLPRPIDWWGSF